MITSQQIKSIVSMQSVLARYGISVTGVRCRCFVHGGDNLSMQVFDNAVRCYVCGKSWDIFEVVQILCNRDFKTALKIIKSDFGISTDFDTSKIDRARIERQRIKSERDKLIDEWVSLRFVIDYWNPSDLGGAVAVWVDAIKRIDLVEYELGMI